MIEKKTRNREKKIENNKTFSINLSAKDHTRLTFIADHKGKSVSAVMRELVGIYIKENMKIAADVDGDS